MKGLIQVKNIIIGLATMVKRKLSQLTHWIIQNQIKEEEMKKDILLLKIDKISVIMVSCIQCNK